MVNPTVLSQISVYPVKSTSGISLSSSWVEKQGLCFDRRFMLMLVGDSRAMSAKYPTMVTARQYPNMVKVASSLRPTGIVFTYPGMPPLELHYANFNMHNTNAIVWRDHFSAYTTTDEADDWFSKVIGKRVTLIFTGEQSNRIRENTAQPVSFADGFPLLLISSASLDELNRRSSEVHNMAQFRTNLVVQSDEPFIEDSWKRIKIGDVEFETVEPCERCILTTLNVDQGAFRANKEPLKTFSRFRANEDGKIFFGQNLIAKNEGMISTNDIVEVLEYKAKERYEDLDAKKQEFICVARETVAKDFETFWLKPKTDHTPSYKAGQHLPIEVLIDNQRVKRTYTLSSSPTRPERLAISVKRVHGGKVSNWLLAHLQTGGTIIADQPKGSFHLSEASNAPLLLLSAGSGVTPMMSILRDLTDRNDTRDIVFYHQCVAEDDIPFKQELRLISEHHPNVTITYLLSKPSEHWPGQAGRFNLSHLKQIPDFSSRQVFVCGPSGFMENIKKLMLTNGLREEQYHQETFGISRAPLPPYKKVKVCLDGVVFEGDNQSTILEQAEAAGLSISNSCRAGFCGACKCTVKSGSVHQADAPAIQASEKAQGQVLACCAVPITDITLVCFK
ncbi:TPA: hybrid-cluster NAD(P)-dependent oxidoreductase [Vibrio alginolyticus]|uniref:hybrid-cluster NAD(P)-dependent oxidoreductase n=1 Tax=Vibrio sp. YT-17 TaxID=3074708 RepID=UPI0029641ECD|nr:hybrid-cluster NAD(P)-dependent oxidoreductase [Vibrio sp. YT-17]MDW1539114.1 hybrid-cluster NAD(P)-dependent oxidoreductase [Vibrio sp. YT-17]